MYTVLNEVPNDESTAGQLRLLAILVYGGRLFSGKYYSYF